MRLEYEPGAASATGESEPSTNRETDSAHVPGIALKIRVQSVQPRPWAPEETGEQLHSPTAQALPGGKRWFRGRLTWDDVHEIRRLRATEKTTLAKLAVRFGMSSSAIWHITTGMSWRDGTEETSNAPLRPLQKLSWTKVHELRALHGKGWSFHRLAQRYGVTYATIRFAAHGYTWKDGTTSQAPSHWWRKIKTREDIERVRAAWMKPGATYATVASETGLSPSHVSCILRGKRWKRWPK